MQGRVYYILKPLINLQLNFHESESESSDSTDVCIVSNMNSRGGYRGGVQGVRTPPLEPLMNIISSHRAHIST